MAPPSKRSPAKKNPVTCALCNTIIGRKADFPRHMRLHDTGKESLMIRCPFEDCSYKNLQKSNVETHIRTHTGEKTQCCPDCEFTTCDPGSLTRHRKRLHDYDPKSRLGSSEGKIATPKKSVRHAPYSRGHSKAFSASSSATPPSHHETQDLTCHKSCEHVPSPSPSSKLRLPSPCSSVPSRSPTPYDDCSFAWNKTFFPDDIGTLLPQEPTTPDIIPRTPSPKHMFPAVDAGVLEEVELSRFWEASNFGFLSPPFTDFMASAPPPQYIVPNCGLTGPTLDHRSSFEVFNPTPQYATCGSSWSLSEYMTTLDVPAVALPSPPSNEFLFVNWEQILNNPPSVANTSSPPSSYDSFNSSPASSPLSNEFSLPPLTPQEFEQFVLECNTY